MIGIILYFCLAKNLTSYLDLSKSQAMSLKPPTTQKLWFQTKLYGTLEIAVMTDSLPSPYLLYQEPFPASLHQLLYFILVYIRQPRWASICLSTAADTDIWIPDSRGLGLRTISTFHYPHLNLRTLLAQRQNSVKPAHGRTENPPRVHPAYTRGYYL